MMTDGTPTMQAVMKAQYDIAPAFKRFQEFIERTIREKNEREAAIVREMLGRWVSELEPVIVYQRTTIWLEGRIISWEAVGDQIIGLTARGHDKIIVRRGAI